MKKNQYSNNFFTFKPKANSNEQYFLTILDDSGLYSINLSDFNKSKLTFGQSNANDIIIDSNIVDLNQGYLEFTEYGVLVVNTSTQIPILGKNNKAFNDFYLSDKSFVKIIDPITMQGILMIMSITENPEAWEEYNLKAGTSIIGSSTSCDIVLPPSGIERKHLSINLSKNKISAFDEFTTNGTFVNGQVIPKMQEIILNDLDVIFIGDCKIILYKNKFIYQISNKGIQLDAIDIVKKVRVKFKTKVISSHVSMSIKPAELVAFVGGSGTGKSTFMKCICGVTKPSSGTVLLNGENLYESYDTLKYNIGYVPQDDIVYSNLTLYDMLHYTAKLRLPDYNNPKELTEKINQVLQIVQLSDFKNSFIRQLSGGQRKRASIAVELLANPSLFFLDEPTSGLDPGTERSIMKTLKSMSQMGKTIILVTHNTLNLHLCDKVAFFSSGGRLCFYGSPLEALEFFGVDDFVDIYTLLNENPNEWYEKFNNTTDNISYTPKLQNSKNHTIHKKVSFFKQFINLTKRNIKLITNDIQQLFLLFTQAPIIAFLLTLVANSNTYAIYEDTKKIMFAIGCACIWLGLLNSIQEICKEKVILHKEHMADLKLSAYLLSKFIIQGILAFIQSTLLVSIFQSIAGKSDYNLLFNSYWDIQIICFLSIWSSATLGLFISALVKNSNIAMIILPLILVAQLLFSGMLFNLEDLSKFISNFTLCRWTVEGLGSSVNLNELTHLIQTINPLAEVKPEDYFIFTSEHMIQVISIIILMAISFLIISYLVLKKKIKKDI